MRLKHLLLQHLQNNWSSNITSNIVNNRFIINYNMKKFSTIKEIFALFIHKRKFHMFPIIILLITLIGVTALAQSGLVAFIYPI
jgi:hypothetical protein